MSAISVWEARRSNWSSEFVELQNVERPSKPNVAWNILVDVSGSAYPLRQQIIAEMENIFTKIGDEDQFNVMAVNHDAVACFPIFVSASNENKTKSVNWVTKDAPCWGGSALHRAIELIQKQWTKTNPQHILYITDGMFFQPSDDWMRHLIEPIPKVKS